MAIFGLSRVDYPRNRLRFLNLTKFENPYVYVLFFLSKMVSGKSLRLLEYSRTVKSESDKTLLKVMVTIKRVGFGLISRPSSLIRHFFLKLA